MSNEAATVAVARRVVGAVRVCAAAAAVCVGAAWAEALLLPSGVAVVPREMVVGGERKRVDSVEPEFTVRGGAYQPASFGMGLSSDAAGSLSEHLYRDDYGWPFKSLASFYALDAETGTRFVVARGIEIGSLGGRKYRPHLDWFRTPYALPIIPGFGLVLNAMLYAGVWFSITRGARAIRDRSRRSRGLCRSCGYPVMGGLCPECGSTEAGEAMGRASVSDAAA